MSSPPFVLRFTPEAEAVLDDLRRHAQHRAKWKKVQKTLVQLRDAGPSYPGLNTHKYTSLKGPAGEDVWECYVENRTPSAWRLFWIYGPGPDTVTVVTLGPHP